VVLEGPDGATAIPYNYQVAGDEIVFGITGNGVTKEVIEQRFAAHPADNAPKYFHQVQLHYWMESDCLSQITGRSLGVHMQRLPSVGLFGSPLTVWNLLGLPYSGVYQSRIMDVKGFLVGAASDDPAHRLAAMQRLWLQSSYLEGLVFIPLRREGRRTRFHHGGGILHRCALTEGQVAATAGAVHLRGGHPRSSRPQVRVGRTRQFIVRDGALHAGEGMGIPGHLHAALSAGPISRWRWSARSS
jgi:hypothetical protein